MEERSGLRFFILTVVILLTVLFTGVGVFVVMRLTSDSKFYINSIEVEDIDDIDGYLKKYSEARGLFADDEMDRQFVSYHIDENEEARLKGWRLFLSRLFADNINVRITYKLNEQALKNYIDEYNVDKIESKDAYINPTEDGYEVVPEVKGTKISYDALLEYIDGRSQIQIEDCAASPAVKATDLQEECDGLNEYAKWSVTYDNGSVLHAPAECVTWDAETKEVSVDDSFLDGALSAVEEEYNTVGAERSFHTSAGNDITVSGGTFGRTIDHDDELEELKSLFSSKDSVTGRVPVLAFDKGELGNTYVEISISSQHLWLYKDGVMLGETDVVTGQGMGKKGATPRGVYYISEMVPGKYLVGDDYRTWVNRWMRLTNSGVGLHDAGWRRSFGGDIYHRDGSHGCINLPADFAYWIYDNVEVNMPVVIY